jgi:DNA polymerase-3 subunit beta
MFFEASRQTLLPALRMVSGIVERRQTLPILANVLVRVEGGKLYLTATDSELELACSLSLQADIEGDGEGTIPALKWFDICRALSDDFVIQMNQENTSQMVIKSGRSRFTLSCLPAADFPVSEDLEADLSFSLPQKTLKYLISKTHFAMAQQDVRYYLNGLLLDIQTEALTLVATDGHRLALASEAIKNDVAEDAPVQVIIPRKTVLELNKILEDNDNPVEVSLNKGHIRFNLGDVQLTSKLIDGRYPNYQSVVPLNPQLILTANTQVLRQALSRTAILSNEKFKGVRLSLGADTLTLNAHNPEQEEAEETIDVSYSGDQFEIGFNVQYLLDALSVIDTEHVSLNFPDANSSCLLQMPETDTLKYVVMPMRL